MSDLRKPVGAGLLAALGLVGLYLSIVRIGSASWPHTVELLLADWYLVVAVASGFGIQMGMFTHFRRLVADRAVRPATAMAAGGTATSTTSMVACCLHHLADVLPVIGLSGAAIFFTTYKVP
ncbi:MAG TPA: hypothetical protein VFM39_03205, partial [bacterium]|nr:hypothetical protein [bacterium]